MWWGAQHALADASDIQPKPCYDQSGLMRQFDYIAELVDCLEELGWGPYQCDHEDANGQFEINWGAHHKESRPSDGSATEGPLATCSSGAAAAHTPQFAGHLSAQRAALSPVTPERSVGATI